ncbi:MAG TPA: FAD-dependent monooxygenase [Terrimicrobiaceae bacterium]
MITIVGGGLAGLSLGIALCRRGVAVTLHEAGSYPRHRVCGEFISGVSNRTFDSLGIGDLFNDAKRHHSTIWFSRARKILTAQLPVGLGISRFTLDARLSRRFRELGGVLCEHSRQKPRIENGLVCCAGRMPARGNWIGLKCHVLGLKLHADLEMHLASNGYVGLANVEHEKVNVCGLFRLQLGLSGKGIETLERYLCAGGLDALALRIFAAGVDAESFLGVAGFRLGWQKPRDETAALGDAFGMIPPFTGNGMSMAFESAEIAADRLNAWQAGRRTWAETLERLNEELKLRFARRMFWGQAMHPFLTTGTGQAFFTLVSRSGLLPFKTCFHALR